MSNLINEIEYINEMADSLPLEFINKCEARYQNIIDDVVKKVCAVEGRKVVMLAGPSSSGKTTTAKRIVEGIKSRGVNAYVLSLDDFYKNRDTLPTLPDGTKDFETVYALDLDYFGQTVNALMTGQMTKTPVFDFSTGCRSEEEFNEITMGENDIVVIEGLHALNPIILDHIECTAIKIYISLASRIYNEKKDIILNKRNLRFIRRLVRDYQFRGSSADNTFRLWKNVMYGEDKYLFPYRDNFDYRINTIHLYEPCVLKHIALELLKNSEISDEFAYDVQRLCKSLEKFEDIDPSLVPQDSLLREFLGK
ncbi:MAG: nucleoside kinase [Clostridiales bacterium]|nr:nucleoside kinase [Clostridiales bacterium]